MNDHPDVVLAIQHRGLQERREAMREREPDPVDVLRREVAELALIVSELCAHNVADALGAWGNDRSNEGLRENTALARDLHERAAALERRLR